MTSPTRRQIMQMADKAGIADYNAAARLVRLALEAFRPAPAEPVGDGPSDEELIQLAIDTRLYRFQATAGDPIQYEMTEQQVHAFARAVLSRWGSPATPPAPEPPAGALAARPLLEKVARLGDVIGQQTVAQVQQLAEQAAVWLRDNPPGQPVAIEPRGCPTPGACTCVEPALPLSTGEEVEP